MKHLQLIIKGQGAGSKTKVMFFTVRFLSGIVSCVLMKDAGCIKKMERTSRHIIA